ncbi:MAG: hypothetical protein JO158_10350 [Gammaproteobacteria bacterium]|nr:hypothetical protein [Gammaproteobacteria bacterium]
MRRFASMLAVLLLASAGVAEEPEEPPQKSVHEGQPVELSLTMAQQQAVGIRTEYPVPLATAPPIEAYGTVLDPLALATDAGRMESTEAAASAAAADAARQERLYRDEAQASLKALQAAQAQAVEAAAQARAAALSFRLQWGPLAHWSAAQRRALLEGLSSGRQRLLRADLPGQHVVSAIAPTALLEVDGVNLTARVLGALPRSDAQSQSAAWLLLLEHAPEGLGPGARALVRMHSAASASGVLVPAGALLYAENGTYVYRQLHGGGADKFVYAPVTVRPLARLGSAWLVDGLTRSDPVVVQGAGVLWSLQGISSFSAAEEEHD